MENPESHGEVERVIKLAHQEWHKRYREGAAGLSMAASIAAELRAAGLLLESVEEMEHEPEWEWLSSTRHLQETSFKVDYESLTGDKLADYLLVNAFALADELHEAMAEASWKPWAKNRGEVNRSNFADELVDLLHFAANMLAAVGVDDEELWKRYRAKQERNAVRQSHGYDARASKCPGCRRELDKPRAIRRVATFTSHSTGKRICTIRCAGCGGRLGFQAPMSQIEWDRGVEVPGLRLESFTEDSDMVADG
jgi:hypothetical protein